jgi:hypothetical protein
MSCSLFAGTAWTGPDSTSVPLTSRTWTIDNFGSGGSVNVMVTFAGAWSSNALAAGSELARFAWAAAMPADPSVTAAAIASGTSMRATRLTLHLRP